MRLRSLYIGAFKNLIEFTINFESVFNNVLVGPNGTGKSNVLEALIVIFRDLDLKTDPAFIYRLEYECRGYEVEINADPFRKTSKLKIKINGKSLSQKEFLKNASGSYLPKFVFGYYSGPSDRMESHFRKHQEIFATELLNGNERPLRPLLYARLVHSQFVLLSFFRTAQEDRRTLEEFLRINDLDSVLFVLKKPYWADAKIGKSNRPDGNPRFWGARGVVSELLDRIYELSLAPMRTPNGDRWYLFLKNKAAVMELAKHYPGQQDFFAALESLYISDLIENVRTDVKIIGVENSLTFRELSEGEQQLLMVLGLLRFVEDEEGLIILDEPDTHLNPGWSINYHKLLNEHVSENNRQTTQIVMTTHDPLVVASLEAKDVIIMRREKDGAVSAAHPEHSPRGMGIAGVLTSDVYGLRSSLDPITLAALDRKRELATKQNLTFDESKELNDLNKDLEVLDASNTVRDPLYKPFVEAMSKLEPELRLQAIRLTREQMSDRADVASSVIKTLVEALSEE